MAAMVNNYNNTNKPNLFKSHKPFLVTQIFLRVLAVAFTFVAALLTLTNTQTVLVFGIQIRARYSLSPTLRFFAYANVVACVCTTVSVLAVALQRKALDQSRYFYVFLHDLMMTVLVSGGCAAGTAMGYVAKHGNSRAGWMPVCGFLDKFCKTAIVACFMSYFGFLAFVVLAIVSAHASRNIIVVAV